MQHERISIGSELGNEERHSLGHQAGNESHVARKPIQLGHQDRTFLLTRCSRRARELGPSIESVGSLAGFDLSELTGKADALGFSKTSGSCSLSLQAKSWSTLVLG